MPMCLCAVTYMRMRVSAHNFGGLTLLVLSAASLTVLWLWCRRSPRHDCSQKEGPWYDHAPTEGPHPGQANGQRDPAHCIYDVLVHKAAKLGFRSRVLWCLDVKPWVRTPSSMQRELNHCWTASELFGEARVGKEAQPGDWTPRCTITRGLGLCKPDRKHVYIQENSPVTAFC